MDWLTYDNKAGKPSGVLGSTGPGPADPAGAVNVPAGSYVLARITAEGARPGMAVSVYLRRETGGLRVVGIDREWPGRSLVDPRIVVRPVRNRYVELDAERQRIFDTYARAMNVKLGENLSPEERFRALSPSEQTTFDAITHALMHSTLTDDAGQPLGRALDLVAGVDRIAGEQAGTERRSAVPDLRDAAAERARRAGAIARVRPEPREHGLPRGLSALVPSGRGRAERAVLDGRGRAAAPTSTSTIARARRRNRCSTAISRRRIRMCGPGDNAQRHERRWSGFANWWSDVFGAVRFGDQRDEAAGPFGGAPTRPPSPVPPNRPANASIPDIADAVQEFLTDWLIRRNYQEAAAFFAPDVLPLRRRFDGHESQDLAGAPAAGEPAAAGEDGEDQWGRPTSLTEAMNPVVPWSPAVRIVKHAFEQDFTIVEAPTELGAQYECGATPPKKFVPSATPQYGTYYGALLQVVQ